MAKANKNSPFAGWIVSLNQNKPSSPKRKKRRHSQGNDSGRSWETAKPSTKINMDSLFNNLAYNSMYPTRSRIERENYQRANQGLGYRYKPFSPYTLREPGGNTRMWDPDNIGESMNRMAGGYGDADNFSRFMYAMEKYSKPTGTTLDRAGRFDPLGDAIMDRLLDIRSTHGKDMGGRNYKSAQEAQAEGTFWDRPWDPGYAGNSKKTREKIGIEKVEKALKEKEAKKKDKDEDDNGGGWWGNVKGHIQDFDSYMTDKSSDVLDKVSGPIYDKGKDGDDDIISKVLGSDALKKVGEETGNAAMRAIDIISRPLFATTSGVQEMIRKDKEPNKNAGEHIPDWVRGVPVLSSAKFAYDVFGTNPVEGIDDMGFKDYGDVGKAMWEGFSGKRKTTYSDVIKTAADRDTRKSIRDNPQFQLWAGLGADIAGDPLNYVGVGLVRAPIKGVKAAKSAAADRAIRGLADDAAEAGVRRMGPVNEGQDELLSSDEIYQMLGGGVRHTSGLNKSRNVEHLIGNLQYIRHQVRDVKKLPSRTNRQIGTLKRQVAASTKRRDKALAAIVEAYNAKQLKVLDDHEAAVLENELRDGIRRAVDAGHLPKESADNIDEAIRVADASVALTKHHYFVQARDELEKAKSGLAGLKPEDKGYAAAVKRVEDATEHLSKQKSFGAHFAGFMDNPNIPQKVKTEILDDVDNTLRKESPEYRASRQTLFSRKAAADESERAFKAAQAHHSAGKITDAAFKTAQSDYRRASRAYAEARQDHNTLRAALFLRYADNYIKQGDEVAYADREYADALKAELDKVSEEQARLAGDTSANSDDLNSAYTGLDASGYNQLLANEGSRYSIPEDRLHLEAEGPQAGVPYNRAADLEQRARFLEQELRAIGSKFSPVESRILDLAKELGPKFRIIDDEGELTDEAAQYFDWDSQTGIFKVKEDAPSNVQEVGKDIINLLSRRARKLYRERRGSELRRRRAGRQTKKENIKDKKILSMFGQKNKAEMVGKVKSPNGEDVFISDASSLVEDVDYRWVDALDRELHETMQNFTGDYAGLNLSAHPALIRKLRYTRNVLRNLGIHVKDDPKSVLEYLVTNASRVDETKTGRRIKGETQAETKFLQGKAKAERESKGVDVGFDVTNAISPEKLAFFREFKKQHGMEYRDAVILRDKVRGKVVKKKSGGELTIDQFTEAAMSGDRNTLARLFGLDSPFRLRVKKSDQNLPVGSLINKTKGLRGDKYKNAVREWADEVIEAADDNPSALTAAMRTAWNDAYNRQIADLADANKYDDPNIFDEINAQQLTPNEDEAMKAQARRDVMKGISGTLQHGTIEMAEHEDFALKLPSTQPAPNPEDAYESALKAEGLNDIDPQQVQRALKARHAEEQRIHKLENAFDKEEKGLAALKARQAREEQVQMDAVRKAAESRETLTRRLDENALLRLIDAKIMNQGKALSIRTWGDHDLFNVPGSQTLFKITDAMSKLPIIKQTRQAFADTWISPSSRIPSELALARNRALGNTPQIIKLHLDELEQGLGQVHHNDRISAFKKIMNGQKGGQFGPDVTAEIEKLLPYFQGKVAAKGDRPLTISEINRYLPSHLQIKLNKNAYPASALDLMNAMKRGGKHARKLAGTRKEVKEFPKDPMDILWETRVAVEQAMARRQLLNAINTFGVKRSRKMIKGSMRPPGKDQLDDDTYNLIEKLGSQHGWETLDETGNSHYFSPEVMPDVKKVLELMEPRNITKFGRMADEVTGMWKTLATTYNFGYYTRNGIGEMMSGWLGGVDTIKPYRQAYKLGKYMRGEGREIDALRSHVPGLEGLKGETELARETAVTLRNGQKVSNEQATALYFDMGLKTGFFNTERQQASRGRNFIENLKENKVTGAAGKVHHRLRNFGEDYEDHFRLAHFLDAMSKAKTNDVNKAAQYAAEQVRKYHFDYTDFTDFEKTVMLRAFPFYKWTRKSLPLMSTMLFQKPGKMSLYPKVANAVSNQLSTGSMQGDDNGFMPNYEGIVPNWIEDMWGYKVDEDEASSDNQETYFNLATPQMDALKTASNPKGAFNTFLHPAAKIAIEQGTGHTMPGNSMDYDITSGDERFSQLMRQLPQTNYLDKRRRGAEDEESTASFFTGLGFYQNNDKRRMGEKMRREGR